MRLLVCLLLLLSCGLPGRATAGVLTQAPLEDVGLPFWCDWGYDWDERCYRDNTARLPVGGVDDKVWRAALRFSLDGLPPAALIASARLDLYFDGACVAPRRRVGPCSSAVYTVDAHRILSASWTKERELDFDPSANGSTSVPTTSAGWSSWDLTGVVSDWAAGGAPNHGVLLKLAEEEENYGVSGPYFASASFGLPAYRPRLVVFYSAPATGVVP
jgi:hypothetical protein